jgi:hypothetical protein
MDMRDYSILHFDINSSKGTVHHIFQILTYLVQLCIENILNVNSVFALIIFTYLPKGQI